MGEISDAMLDGTLCAACGTYIGSDNGFATYCSEACDPDAHFSLRGNRGKKREPEGQSSLPRFSPYNVPPRAGAIECAHCPRWIMPAGMAQHMRDKHPGVANLVAIAAAKLQEGKE